ncbi:hypothetical protein V2J09_017684 [Rumex salicifolius]
MGGRAALGSSSIVPSLPPPCPRSPPTCPDLSGRRREIVKIQLLEREMSLLEGELKLIQGVQLASTCCKEVLDLVDAKSDPLVPIKKKKRSARDVAVSGSGSAGLANHHAYSCHGLVVVAALPVDGVCI